MDKNMKKERSFSWQKFNSKADDNNRPERRRQWKAQAKKAGIL